MQFGNGLQFHNDLVFNEQVHPIARFDLNFSIDDGECAFLLDAEPFLLQFIFHADPVGAFKKAWTQS